MIRAIKFDITLYKLRKHIVVTRMDWEIKIKLICRFYFSFALNLEGEVLKQENY